MFYSSWYVFMRLKIIIICAVIILVILGIAFVIWNHDPERDDASCDNCRSQISGMLGIYAEMHNKYYPIGDGNPLDVLVSKLELSKYGDVGWLASHNRWRELNDHWNKYHTVSEDISCYRYNQGLRTDDPGEMIIMYYFKPTRLDCESHIVNFTGRPILDIKCKYWSFITEGEFQERQQLTVKYIRDHKRIESIK
jgi:hypothetical protein